MDFYNCGFVDLVLKREFEDNNRQHNNNLLGIYLTRQTAYTPLTDFSNVNLELVDKLVDSGQRSNFWLDRAKPSGESEF